MIEKIVSKIRKKNVEWEVFSIKTIKNSFNFLNCELEKSKFEIEEKAAVRVYFDGKLGFSVCNNKNQIEKAIKMAIKNAKIKGKIGFDFSFSEKNVDRFERVHDWSSFVEALCVTTYAAIHTNSIGRLAMSTFPNACIVAGVK